LDDRRVQVEQRMHCHVEQQTVSDERGEQHEADLSARVTIVELLLVLRPVDACNLHRLVQVRKDHLRRGLRGQIHGINTDERTLRCKSHIFAICRYAEAGDRSMLVRYQEQKLAVPIEQIQRSG